MTFITGFWIMPRHFNSTGFRFMSAFHLFSRTVFQFAKVSFMLVGFCIVVGNSPEYFGLICFSVCFIDCG